MIGHDDQRQPGRTWKVGALARATGLTVRTLHHYDEIARLYRIIRLRQLGFPLSQVAEVLAEPEWQLAPAIERHLAEARHRAAMDTRLCTRLAAMAAELARPEHPSPQELFSTVEEMIITGGAVHGTAGFLMYDDVDAAHEYIVRVLGLTAGQVWKSEDGFTEFGEVRAR